MNTHQRDTGRASNHAQPAQAPAPQIPAVVVNQPSPAIAQDDRASNAQQSYQLWPTFLERTVDPVTWFTGFLLVVSILQWLAMRRQARLMSGQLTVAVDAAVAAKKSADVAEEALHIVNRAALNVIESRAEERPDGRFPDFLFQITNSGVVEAQMLRCGFGGVIGRPLPDFDYRPLQWMDRGGIVSPNSRPLDLMIDLREVTSGDGLLILTAAAWKQIKAGRTSLALYGSVRYDAGFGYIGERGFSAVYDATENKLHPTRRFRLADDARYDYNRYEREKPA